MQLALEVQYSIVQQIFTHTRAALVFVSQNNLVKLGILIPGARIHITDDAIEGIDLHFSNCDDNIGDSCFSENISTLMLPAHFDDVTDDISRLMEINLVRILQELPKSPTRNIKANYEKYRTLNEYSTNLRSMTRCDKSIERILNIPKISPLS